MIQKLLLVAVLTSAFSLRDSSVCAQEPHHPQISIAHKGLKQLRADISLMLKLATDDEIHIQNWDDLITLFAAGLDEERPFRIDALVGLTPVPVVVYGPYTDATELIEDNLEGAEFVPKKITDTLYELLPPERGWLRLLPEEKFAILALSEEKTHNLLKQIIQKADSPANVIQELLATGPNVAGRLLNTATSAEDQKRRKESFAEIRANQMDALQKRPQESQTEFELRQGILSVSQDEVERVIVEAKAGHLLAYIDEKVPNARVVVDWTAIDGTSLAEIMAAFGKKEDAFASVQPAEKSAFSLRVNHPLDEMRQENARKIMALLKADIVSRMNKPDSKMTDAQKTATEKLIDVIFELVRDSNSTGNINAFMESVPSENDEFVTWGAILASKPKRLDAALALIPETSDGNEVEIKIESVKGVDIHRVRLKKGFLEIFDRTFGDNADVYFGTSESMVWFSAGPDSLPALKQAIESLGEPAASDNILKADIELGPWARRAEKITRDLPEPADPDEQETRRNTLLTLKEAVEALTDEDDDLHFNLEVKAGKAINTFSANTGVLRFIGSQLEKFSRNNL